jgi:hypothetical protein
MQLQNNAKRMRQQQTKAPAPAGRGRAASEIIQNCELFSAFIFEISAVSLTDVSRKKQRLLALDHATLAGALKGTLTPEGMRSSAAVYALKEAYLLSLQGAASYIPHPT